MNPADLFLDAVDQAKARHPQLRLWLASARANSKAAQHLRIEEWDRGAAIAHPGTEEHTLRFLVRGQAVVGARDDEGRTTPVRTLDSPCTFGGAGFALGRSRTAGLVALTPATTLALSRKDFRALGQSNPTLAVALLRWVALDMIGWLRESRAGKDSLGLQRSAENPERNFQATASAREPVPPDSEAWDLGVGTMEWLRCFQGATPAPLVEALGASCHLLSVRQGGHILAHGETDHALYVLLDGEASVYGASGRVLARFVAGGASHEVLMGEVGFLDQSPRDGTVTADLDCLVLQLPARGVGWVLAHHPDLAVRIHLALVRTFCWRLIEADAERQRLLATLDLDLDAWSNG